MSESQLYKECAEAGRPELSAGSEVSTAVYENFLPAALAAGKYQAAPEPHVVGHGLRHIQAALDAQLKGVSAAKIVVSLDAR